MGDCRSQSEDEPSDTDDLEFYPYPEDDALAAFDAHVYQQLNRRALFQHDTQGQTTPGPVHWGGKVTGIQLCNTCPLDNFFTVVLVAIINSRRVELTFTTDEQCLFSKNLIAALKLVDEKKDSSAKLQWASFLGLKANQAGIIDFHSSEYSRFIGPYSDAWLKATVESVCRDCTLRQVRHTTGLTLPPGHTRNLASTEEALYQALKPPLAACAMCGGVKEWRRRVFIRETLPPLLVLEVPPESQRLEVYQLADFPPLLGLHKDHFQIPLFGDPAIEAVGYLLVGGTFADGHHFCGAFLSCLENARMGHGWYSYDGLIGHSFQGALAPKTPLGSLLSSLIFMVIEPEFADEAARLMKWMNE